MSGWKKYRISALTWMTRLSGFASLLFLLSVSSAFAQVGERVDAPVTVTVQSKIGAFGVEEVRAAFVPFGGEARISGTSVPLGDKDAVTIDVTAPDKSTSSLNGKLTLENTYAVVYNKTKMTGIYTVTAKSPDGKSTAKTTFRVVSALELGETTDKLFSSLTQIADKTGKVVQAAQDIINDQGDFPGREQIDRDIDEIEETLDELPELLDEMRDAFDRLSEFIEKYPGAESVPELGEVVKDLSDAIEDAETMIEQLDDLYKRASDELSICDRLDAAVEAFNGVGLVFDLITGTWAQRAVSLVMSLGLPDDIYNSVFPDDDLGFAGKTAFTESVKNIVGLVTNATDTIEDYLKSPTGLTATLAQSLIVYGFGDMCEHFVGPIEGIFSIDSTVGQGLPFWGYKTYIKGRLILRYETKYKTGKDPIPLTGEFEGTATKFEVYEDLYVTGDELVKSKILARILQQPGAAGEIINWIGLKAGSLPAMAIPHYFKVRVTGSYSLGDSITIEIAPKGQQDFLPGLHAVAYYVLLPSTIIPIPLVERFDIPIQNAQFILSRGLRNTSTMKVATGKSSKGSLLNTIEQTFTREEVVSDGEVTVKWNLKVKACNPECD